MCHLTYIIQVSHGAVCISRRNIYIDDQTYCMVKISLAYSNWKRLRAESSLALISNMMIHGVHNTNRLLFNHTTYTSHIEKETPYSHNLKLPAEPQYAISVAQLHTASHTDSNLHLPNPRRIYGLPANTIPKFAERGSFLVRWRHLGLVPTIARAIPVGLCACLDGEAHGAADGRNCPGFRNSTVTHGHDHYLCLRILPGRGVLMRWTEVVVSRQTRSKALSISCPQLCIVVEVTMEAPTLALGDRVSTRAGLELNVSTVGKTGATVCHDSVSMACQGQMQMRDNPAGILSATTITGSCKRRNPPDLQFCVSHRMAQDGVHEAPGIVEILASPPSKSHSREARFNQRHAVGPVQEDGPFYHHRQQQHYYNSLV